MQSNSTIPAAETSAPADPLSVLITVTIAMLAACGIDPQKASKEEIAAAIESKLAAACSDQGDDGAEGAQLAELQAKLDAALAQLAERDAAAFASEIASYNLDEATQQALAAIPAAQRSVILAALPKSAAPAAASVAMPPDAGAPAVGKGDGKADGKGGKGNPPAPIHSTAATKAQAPADKAAEIGALIKSIQTAQGSKFKDYTAAREEARRQRPELFA